MNQASRADHSLDAPRHLRSESLCRPSVRKFVAASCALVVALASLAGRLAAQEMGDLPVMEDAFEAGAPAMEMGGGDFFSQELGTLLRLRYNTESYGQDRRGNFDIGTMQVQNFEDAIAFFDGQVTLNDVNGVGYNLGVGFRWLHWSPFPVEPERITGFSFWTDGTSTESGNFFPQIGLSFESLGDRWDLRINGYIPVGQKSQLGEFIPTGNINYDQNFLVEEAVADRNTSFYVAEAEVAARLLSDRDAWAFAGPYTLVNDDQDTVGYRAGFRGYAYPDLLAQIAVSNDDIFKTNAAFQVTWFVGRTRNNFEPACGLLDRMREPVMRNDYVALQRTQEVGGDPLTGTDGELIRIVHVYSDAPSGGNGTFESPLNDIGDVQANSIENDIVLLWSQSIFANQNTLVLQDNQRLLGEGNGEFFVVATQEQGNVVLPETRPGSRDFARSIIQGTTGSGAVELADANEVANFNIDGTGSAAGAEGIFSPGTGAGNPNIHDLDISNVTGTGIQFTPLTRTDDDNPALMTVAGNVTIDDVNFDNMGDVEIDINSATTTDVTDPNVTLQETIAISDVDSQEGSNIGVWLRNTHDNGTSTTRITTITNYVNGTSGTAGSGGGALASGVLVFEGTMANDFDGNVTLTNIDIFNNTGYALHFNNVSSDSATTITNNNGLTWNGGAGAAGGMRFNSFNGTFTGNSSALSNGTLSGVRITGNSSGTIDLNSTVTFDSIDPGAGEAIFNIGPGAGDVFSGDLLVDGNVTNHDTGRLVSIQRMNTDTTFVPTVMFAGTMTDVPNTNSTGILVADNLTGTVTFSNTLTIDTTNSNAIDLQNNNDAVEMLFNGRLLVTSDGANARAFEATGGGTLTVAANNNEITSNGSAGVVIDDMVISATGANFGDVNVASSSDSGIILTNNTGDAITIGTLGAAGDSGTIENTVGDAVVIENSAEVTVNSLVINATAGQSGVRIEKNTTGTQLVDLNDLEINDGEIGVNVVGNGTGTLDMTINDTTINDPTGFGLVIDNIDTGPIDVVNTTIDGDITNAGAQGVQIVNSNANITFDSATSILNFAGTAFEVDGGGGTGVTTYNGEITSTIGQSILVQNRNGGTVTFSTASNVTDTGGGVRVTTNTAGTVNFNGVLDLDTTTNDAVRLTNNTGATINFTPPGANPLDINTTTGNGFVATGGGTLTVAGANNSITTTTGTGLQIEGMTIGSVDFESVDVNGAVNGIRLANNTTGTITVGDAGAAVGAGGTLQSTTDQAIYVENSNATFNGVTVQNAGNNANENAVEILHTNATAMTANLNRLTVSNATAARDGVVIDGTSGSGTFNANIQNLNVDVTGTGLVVDEGVTLTAGGTNTIDTVTGVGLTVTDSTIGAAGANFQSVTVTNGATSGILLSNLTGGQLAVTGTGTTSGSGGTLDTTGDAIAITNAANVSLSNINVVDSANAVAITKSNTAAMATTLTNVDITNATNDGVNVSVTSSGVFDLTINNSDISGVTNQGFELTAGGTATDVDVIIDQMTTSETVLVNTANNTSLDFRLTNSTINANTAMNINSSGNFDLLVENSALDSATGTTFDLALGANAQDGDIIIRNNATFEAGDGKALEMTYIGANIDVDLLVTANSFSNASAASETVDIFVMGGALVDSNITDNSFTNSLAADEFAMESDGSTTRINLNLTGNTSSGVYELTTTNKGAGFNFGVVDRDTTGANNTGTVNFNPIITDFEDIPGPIDPPVLP